jgi:hypothetical protein
VREPSRPAEAVTLADLETDPHPVLARLRDAAPVCWVPVLGAWLVTGYQLAVQVLRDARAFTVDDPRFSTAKVVGPSMLSLDGTQHARHRAPFTRPFRADEIHARLESSTRDEASRLVTAIRPRGSAELRRERGLCRPGRQPATATRLRPRPAFLPRRSPGPAGGADRRRGDAAATPPAAPGPALPQRADRPGLPQAGPPFRVLASA